MVRRTSSKKPNKSPDIEKTSISELPLKRSARNITKTTKYIDSISDTEDFQEEISEGEGAIKKRSRSGNEMKVERKSKKRSRSRHSDSDEDDMQDDDEEPEPDEAQVIRKSNRNRRASAVAIESTSDPAIHNEETEEMDHDVDANYSEDDAETFPTKSVHKSHQLKWSECEEAAEEGLKYMSQYVNVFEPFITSKVHEKLKHLHDLIMHNKKLRDVYYNDVMESIGQPNTIINCSLRDYQLEGISWIVDRYDKAMNVILADEMVIPQLL